ncbi:DNA phosphorothioation-associated protein 4 [Synechococcus moorigangaii CMS01]|nr:DNA phosphorothioation-associated protein 4 [Synechococcus moorigangaii CMS01]
MGDTRIKIAKDKSSLVKSLRAASDTTGPFQSYADVLVFAAAIGIQRQSRRKITEYSKEIDPIRQDIFYGKGYDQAINLIAIADTNDPNILASSNDFEEKIIAIFEEYANAGLELLQNRILVGSSNYTESILLLSLIHI